MRKNFIVLILGLICLGFSAEAQTKRVSGVNYEAGVKQVYHVLKSDDSVRQGPFAAYTAVSDELLCEGFYDHNKKDSVWKYYTYGKLASVGSYKEDKKVGVWEHFSNGKLSDSGRYENDIEVGVWKYYNEGKRVDSGRYDHGKKVGIWQVNFGDGKPELAYDYTKNSLIYYRKSPTDTATVFGVITGTDTIKRKLERDPIYLDGTYIKWRNMQRSFYYPALARENDISGTVIIGVTIDSTGLASNFRVKKGIGSGCDEAVLKAVSTIAGDWLPGMLNSQPVTVEIDVPFHLVLGK